MDTYTDFRSGNVIWNSTPVRRNSVSHRTQHKMRNARVTRKCETHRLHHPNLSKVLIKWGRCGTHRLHHPNLSKVSIKWGAVIGAAITGGGEVNP